MALDFRGIDLPSTEVWNLFATQMSTGDVSEGLPEFGAFRARPAPTLCSELGLPGDPDEYRLTTLVPGHEEFAGQHTFVACFVDAVKKRIVLIFLKESASSS